MTKTIDALVEALEHCVVGLDKCRDWPGAHEECSKAMRSATVALAQARAEQAEPVEWPLLEKPAKVGGGTFGKGCSARLVVESAYRHAEYDSEEQAQTPEQRREAEMARRKLFDMLNPPAAPVAKLEPVGVVQSPHELNDGWLSKLPIGTALYTVAPAKLEPCPTCESLDRTVMLDKTGGA